MRAKDIKQLICQGESQTLEFKASLSMRNEIGETVSGFSNTEGGTLLVGVSNRGKIKGLDIGKKTVEDFANRIKENTDPQIYPDIKVHQTEGKSIIKITVKESDEKPVFFKDRAYQRVSKTNQRISASKIRELAQQQKTILNWGERVCKRATINDIDEQKIVEFVKEAQEKRNLSIKSKATIQIILRKLGLLKEGKLTNSAILLFGKNVKEFFPQAEVGCAKFKGVEPLEFLDMKVFNGDIFSQIEKAEGFVRDHTNLQAKIRGMKRREKREYPIEAVREALVNAICHRDYESSGNVQVRIFNDRLEVRNPGGLPKGLTVEDLKKDHDSFPRNRSIANCFFLVKLIEKWGTGTNRMVKVCVKHGLPEPEFEDKKISFAVRFNRFFITEDILQQLNDRQKQAIEYLKENKTITRSKYQSLFGCSKGTAYYDLRELSKRDIIEEKGKGKKVYYEITSM